MTYNVHSQDKEKGGRFIHHHRSKLTPLSSEGIIMEKRRIRLYLLDVDVTAATSESGRNKMEA